MVNRKAIGYITANYTSSESSALLDSRPLASIPFMGRYRLIDFPLSNMMNAGIRTVGVVLPPNYRSIVDHLGSGREWELDRKNGGLFLLPGSAYGTAKKGMRFLLRDIIANRTLFQRADEPYVVMAATNIVFNMNLSDVIDAHERSGAQITMIYRRADRDVKYVANLHIGDRGRVQSMSGGCGYGDAEFLDCFIINRDLLLRICEDYAALDYCDLFEAIADDFGRIDICSYEFKGMAVGMFNVQTYYRRSMDMLNPDVMHQLFTHERPIMTKAHDTPPAKYASGSNACNSYISAGCQIEGTVRGSILSRDCIVESGAYVSNSIIMQGCVIKRGARVENAIVDKNNIVPAQTELRGTPDETLVIRKVSLDD